MGQTTDGTRLDRDFTRQLQRILAADKDELFQQLQEQDGELLLAVLRNPRLDEHHLLALLKRRGLGEELFEALFAAKRHLESYKVIVALAVHPETPVHIAQTLLPRCYIFDLARICLLPSVAPDLRLLAERCIIQRLPGQPLGNKLTLARRGTPAVVEALLMEGVASLVEACLANPHLKEGAVHRFVSSHLAGAETISLVARTARWKGRPNIRLAILKNPRTPAVWFTQFLPSLSPPVLKDLLATPRLTSDQKALVREALARRGHAA